MEFVANYTSPLDPVAWARTREREGWSVLGCGDHHRPARAERFERAELASRDRGMWTDDGLAREVTGSTPVPTTKSEQITGGWPRQPRHGR